MAGRWQNEKWCANMLCSGKNKKTFLDTNAVFVSIVMAQTYLKFPTDIFEWKSLATNIKPEENL